MLLGTTYVHEHFYRSASIKRMPIKFLQTSAEVIPSASLHKVLTKVILSNTITNVFGCPKMLLLDLSKALPNN